VVRSHYFRDRIQRKFPNVQFVELESAEAFFSEPPPADALLLSAEEGAAYTFRYPKYTTVLPKNPIRVPAAYALPRGESEWQQVVGNWIDLKRADGSIEDLYRYWMLGGVAERHQPRWSVIRNVLGWVD
jgi:ABC-type amino acid transport substrate-binding protein